MHERKQKMAEMSNAAIALPGGVGTLEELLEIITWKQLGLYKHPIIILNINNYYKPLLEMFENIAYIMAKHAHPDQVPDTPDEWLENFNTFSIYQILPQLIELWGLNVQTEVEARKNLAKVSG